MFVCIYCTEQLNLKNISYWHYFTTKIMSICPIWIFTLNVTQSLHFLENHPHVDLYNDSMAAMPILNFISIDHMFRKPVTDKDFSQIQIHECYACWEEKTCKWVKTCISYINVCYTALFNLRSWPMNAFSHVYMW